MALAPLSKRIYAILFDTLIIVSVILVPPVIGMSGMGYAAVIGIALFLYEPICVAAWGQTPGHRLMGIKVIDSAGRNPSVLQAYGRWIVKGLLGLWSFLTMMLNGNAVHDITTKTKVILRRPARYSDCHR